MKKVDDVPLLGIKARVCVWKRRCFAGETLHMTGILRPALAIATWKLHKDQ
jgi:hypothetical protein